MHHKSGILGGLILAVFLGVMFLSCSKDESSTSPPPPATITVAGKLVNVYNRPVSGVPVVIAGIPSVNTDANGAFTIAGVTTPYSITIVDGNNTQALVYRGLTRSDPTLQFIEFNPSTNHTASLSGKIYPATNYPEPLGRKTQVAFVSPEVTRSVTANGATGAYSMAAVAWYGASTTTGTVFALQWSYNTTTSLPTAYNGYGSRSDVPLLDATNNPNGNDTMSVVSSGSFSGSATPAAGYSTTVKSLSLRVGGTGTIPLLEDATSTGSFSYVTPAIPGATLYLQVTAGKVGVGSATAFKAGIDPNASGVSVSIPAAPELSLPINGTTGVTKSTLFSWTPFTGGVHLLWVRGPAGQPAYFVLTSAVGDSIPNLASIGLGLPASTTYSWWVYGFAPYASTDAAAGPNGFLSGLNTASPSDGSIGLSISRTFTTAP
jgi:hypothetical protein